MKINCCLFFQLAKNWSFFVVVVNNGRSTEATVTVASAFPYKKAIVEFDGYEIMNTKDMTHQRLYIQCSGGRCLHM